MNILFASSEVAPFIKTGGLADVAGSLPAALAKAGHDVRVILPLHEGISPQWRDQMTFLQYFYVPVAWRSSYCGIFELKKDGVTYWFVDNEYYFHREQLYGHYDDGERYTFFSRAVVETPGHLGFSPDIIHCNDWQTALVPVYLLEEKYRVPELAGAHSVFTIHNIEYQGRYGDQVMEDLLGLPRTYFSEKMLAYHGDVNFMQGALYAADFITTVSPSYAEELHQALYGHGLEGVICDCEDKLRGILNGIDTALYDPWTNQSLAKNFSAKQLAGKKVCKAALQQALGLNVDPAVPIIACVSRLVPHKGFGLITEALHDLMSEPVQMVVLGTGDWQYEEAFRHGDAQYPGRFAARLMYSDALSAAIYAGADLLLMPSLAEPCGLSQMIAMRYGTLPIVRETGGLKDSVIPYRPSADDGTGFTFTEVDCGELLKTIHQAVTLYHDDPKLFKKLQKNAMTADFSWAKSAADYLEIYGSLTGK
ncbi:MAG: glycogen synthase GlgA [Oscillospiraceae bacterium]